MKTVHAVFENGVFRPMEPVQLPEKTEVEFEPRQVLQRPPEAEMDAIYEILGRRHSSGHTDTGARHNEHQP